MYSSATDEYPLKNMRHVLVHGRIPSQKHGPSFRPWTNTFSKIMGRVFVLWTNTLSKRWCRYSCCGRIPCQERGASIRPWTNSTCSTNGFPVYSSNLFVFVRGVKLCRRLLGSAAVMLLSVGVIAAFGKFFFHS